MSIRLQQSTTAYKIPFLLILSSDHISPATGKSPTVTISKNGAAFGSPSGAVSEVSGGWYVIAGNATDSNTLGPLMVHVTEASSDNTDCLFEVVAQDLTQALVTANVTQINAVSTSPVTTVKAVQGLTTADTISTCTTTTTTTNLTNAATAGDFTAAMKTSLNASTPASIQGAVNSVTTGVTVTTNNDKTGYTASTVTDKTGYSITGTPDVNVKKINNTTVNGDGGATPWGP